MDSSISILAFNDPRIGIIFPRLPQNEHSKVKKILLYNCYDSLQYVKKFTYYDKDHEDFCQLLDDFRATGSFAEPGISVLAGRSHKKWLKCNQGQFLTQGWSTVLEKALRAYLSVIPIKDNNIVLNNNDELKIVLKAAFSILNLTNTGYDLGGMDLEYLRYTRLSEVLRNIYEQNHGDASDVDLLEILKKFLIHHALVKPSSIGIKYFLKFAISSLTSIRQDKPLSPYFLKMSLCACNLLSQNIETFDNELRGKLVTGLVKVMPLIVISIENNSKEGYFRHEADMSKNISLMLSEVSCFNSDMTLYHCLISKSKTGVVDIVGQMIFVLSYYPRFDGLLEDLPRLDALKLCALLLDRVKNNSSAEATLSFLGNIKNVLYIDVIVIELEVSVFLAEIKQRDVTAYTCYLMIESKINRIIDLGSKYFFIREADLSELERTYFREACAVYNWALGVKEKFNSSGTINLGKRFEGKEMEPPMSVEVQNMYV